MVDSWHHIDRGGDIVSPPVQTFAYGTAPHFPSFVTLLGIATLLGAVFGAYAIRQHIRMASEISQTAMALICLGIIVVVSMLLAVAAMP